MKRKEKKEQRRKFKEGRGKLNERERTEKMGCETEEKQNTQIIVQKEMRKGERIS